MPRANKMGTWIPLEAELASQSTHTHEPMSTQCPSSTSTSECAFMQEIAKQQKEAHDRRVTIESLTAEEMQLREVVLDLERRIEAAEKLESELKARILLAQRQFDNDRLRKEAKEGRNTLWLQCAIRQVHQVIQLHRDLPEPP